MVCKRQVFGGLVLLCLVSPGPSAYAQSVSDPAAGIFATVPTPPIAFVAITPAAWPTPAATASAAPSVRPRW